MYLQQKSRALQFGRRLAENSRICPITSYLWMKVYLWLNQKLRIGLVMRLLSCGANLWRSSANIRPKKVQPLGFYFWHLRLDLFKSLQVTFFVGETEHMCLYTFAGTSVSSARKHLFCNLGARWYNIFNFVLSYLIYGWRPTLWPNQSLASAWWGDIFLVGPTFKNHPQVFGKKKSSPLDSIFDTCTSTSSSRFFVGETEHMCLFPFVGANALSVLPAFHGCIFYL